VLDLLIIAYLLMFSMWFILRRFLYLWKNRQSSAFESVLTGFCAWIMVVTVGAVVCIIFYSGWKSLFVYSSENVLTFTLAALTCAVLLAVLRINRSEFELDDMLDFLKEALMFRRSEKRRVDLIEVMKIREGRKRTDRAIEIELAKVKLEAELRKEKEIELQLKLLSGGTKVDITNIWRQNVGSHGEQSIFAKVIEAVIEPNYKRLSIVVDFRDLSEEKLKDDMLVLRFNREVYEFLQSLRYEGWLKRYSNFFDHYFLVCRAIKRNMEDEEFLYPFLRLSVSIEKLKELEGKYFNPRKLGELGGLIFDGGKELNV